MARDEQATTDEPTTNQDRISDYNIDPTDFELEVENTWRHTTNGYRCVVGRIDGTDIWISYTSSQVGAAPAEYSYSIKGIGRITIDAIDLDTDRMAADIREEATEMRDSVEADDDHDLDPSIDRLIEHADSIADQLVVEYDHGLDQVIGEELYNGNIPVDADQAWAGHVTEAHQHEADAACRDHDVGDHPAGRARDIVRSALREEVNRHTSSHRNPQAEYIARLSFEVEEWELRALELESQGVFRGRRETARVHALREKGLRQGEIAEKLDKAPSTVTRHRDRADEWIARAEWTAKNC